MDIPKNNNDNTRKFINNDLLKNLIEKTINNKIKNSQIWIPAIVKTFDNVKKTITIKEFFPIKDCDTMSDYYNIVNQINEKYFAIYEIPFVSFSTGTFEFSVPIQTGDTVIVLFTLADINSWQDEKITNPNNWFFLPNNAVAIPCIFNNNQSQTRSQFFLKDGKNLDQNNVHLMYKNSHIEFTENNSMNIDSNDLSIKSSSNININSNNFVVSNKVKITANEINILMNISNQLQSIIEALTNIQASPMAPVITTQIASLNVNLAQLKSVLQ